MSAIRSRRPAPSGGDAPGGIALDAAPLVRRRNWFALEAALVAWALLWVGMGYLVDRQVAGVARLGGTVVIAGGAIRQTADALEAVSGVPFVGDRVRQLSESARRTATSAVVNGRAAQHDVDRLAVLLWATIAAAPTLPVFGWYAASRIRRRR